MFVLFWNDLNQPIATNQGRQRMEIKLKRNPRNSFACFHGSSIHLKILFPRRMESSEMYMLAKKVPICKETQKSHCMLILKILSVQLVTCIEILVITKQAFSFEIRKTENRENRKPEKKHGLRSKGESDGIRSKSGHKRKPDLIEPCFYTTGHCFWINCCIFQKFTFYLFACCLTACLASLQFGYNIGVTNLPTQVRPIFSSGSCYYLGVILIWLVSS